MKPAVGQESTTHNGGGRPRRPEAMKATKYIVGDLNSSPDGAAWCVLGSCVQLGVTIKCEWHWSGKREKASKMGRKAAESFASKAEAWMKSNGHNVKLSVVPSTGGMPITRERRAEPSQAETQRNVF